MQCPNIDKLGKLIKIIDSSRKPSKIPKKEPPSFKINLNKKNSLNFEQNKDRSTTPTETNKPTKNDKYKTYFNTPEYLRLNIEKSRNMKSNLKTKGQENLNKSNITPNLKKEIICTNTNKEQTQKNVPQNSNISKKQ